MAQRLGKVWASCRSRIANSVLNRGFGNVARRQTSALRRRADEESPAHGAAPSHRPTAGTSSSSQRPPDDEQFETHTVEQPLLLGKIAIKVARHHRAFFR